MVKCKLFSTIKFIKQIRATMVVIVSSSAAKKNKDVKYTLIAGVWNVFYSLSTKQMLLTELKRRVLYSFVSLLFVVDVFILQLSSYECRDR